MFQTQSGINIPAVAGSKYEELVSALASKTGVNNQQLIEAASFSMAMVLRVALGLDASDAKVGVLINDSLSGAIALACARQMLNAGTNLQIIFTSATDIESKNLKPFLDFFDYHQTECFIWDKSEQNSDIANIIQDQHALLVGMYKFENSSLAPFTLELINLLNDLNTPCHSIISPLGLNAETGEKDNSTLISSSTLSLGVPLKSLELNQDFVGRHYLCDISLSSKLAQEFSVELPVLFSEQPVVQLFPM